ncbi:hypothetical protein [Mucilaginibacter sp. 10I4]|uniref:hypothetical protein n=1 Tax=Mucilaginibacter sp. 10I4 TaxID=3048580 RepID=UPI002B23A0B3|nr:hypothetical protein [Mucilaginibacter sp. 10I4]MEB0262297.1 hypothetical protein [Mucilaginibacter sp. 10I4]
MEPQVKKPKSSVVKTIFILIVLIAAIWYFAGGGQEAVVNNQMQKIENKVALDAEKKYYISERQGDKIQIYVQAGMVAAAYLQAKDETNYAKWKAIEDSTGVVAGISK